MQFNSSGIVIPGKSERVDQIKKGKIRMDKPHRRP